MDLRLGGKSAIVTGASRGIGLAVARSLAAEGAAVALVARGREALDRAAELINTSGGRAVAITADTRDDVRVRAMVEEAANALGRVDILINAAARPASTGPPAALAELSDDAFRDEFETKVLGYLRCARAAAPYMTAQGWGRIVNISGLNARQAGSLVGSVRNVAVAAMTKNLADELGPHGVNVTVVHPGITVTERTTKMLAARAHRQEIAADEVETQLASRVSIGRLVTADEVAAVVTFLASPCSVAVTGDAIAAGGGSRGVIHY